MTDLALWNSCLDFFKNKLTSQQFNLWIKPLAFEMQDEKIILGIPNSFTLKTIQERFLPEIQDQISALTNKKPAIELVLRKNLAAGEDSGSWKKLEQQSDAAAQNKRHNKLNPLYTFENLVQGKANQLAYAAAYQVAEMPSKSYNPLFIYGNVGLGKTHLIHAIGNHIKSRDPQAKICYTTSSNYVSDVVRAFRTNNFDALNQFYNSLDLLLIDDIQFIADKEGSQNAFFQTLTSLTESHRQVVITCDTVPRSIPGMEPRLISRFGWGLAVAIEPPELEMRTAILMQKAGRMGKPIDETVAFFVAKQIESSVRELEGALTKIEAFSNFHNQPITIDLAKEALKDILAAQRKQISVENIQKLVADFYRIKLADLLSKNRTRAIARPRQVAMYLSRELTQLSLPEIGAAFGGRDHTTVLHACRTVENLRNTDTSFNAECTALNQSLRN
jgi:chromosomal replication initiator protein